MLTRRDVLELAAGTTAVTLAPHAAFSASGTVLNDASALNATRVERYEVLTDRDRSEMIETLRRALKAAKSDKRAVSLGCARHSMGGQTLYPDAAVFDFANGLVAIAPAERRYEAFAGCRWRYVTKTLDPLGFSPASMQSNNDFGIAGSISVNAHGWALRHGPVGATVLSLDIMLADGEILTCSRDENADLFGAVIGGYGLLGIILRAELRMAPNRLLKPSFTRMPAAELGPAFRAMVRSRPDVDMAYGRLSVDREHRFTDGLLVAFAEEDAPGPLPPLTEDGALLPMMRNIFRAQIGSDEAKVQRWFAETTLGPAATQMPVTRNTLLSEPVATLGPSPAGRTDILHEYFLPPDRLGEFLHAARDIVAKSRQDCLNVTIRHVDGDTSSVLAYAPTERLGAVMLFSQETTLEAERDMQQMTKVLIDAALAAQGSFYLPYRLHADRRQVDVAYPAAARFAAWKRRYDPGIVFRNKVWDAYFA